MGSGDDGPEAIRQMGVQVELLGPEALRAGDFDEFDVLVLGIRAYETRPDLVAANERVLDFARGGGTLMVQYNKYEFPRGGFAPFQVEMYRPHDRVSDETAPVRILDPVPPGIPGPQTLSARKISRVGCRRGVCISCGSGDPSSRPSWKWPIPGKNRSREAYWWLPWEKGFTCTRAWRSSVSSLKESLERTGFLRTSCP